ncbi:MAG: hypothetical protein ABIW84_07470 [Ilumatobacteraceae bacterium]
MIFPTDAIARAAAEGRKTQTRRLVRAPERKTGRTRNGSTYVYTSKPWRPQDGHHETVQAKGGQPLGHLLITEFRQEPLGTILEPTTQALKDVRAEGHRTRAEFCDAWMRQHDLDWPPLEEELCPTCQGHTRVTANNQPATDGHGFHCTDCNEVGVIYVPAPDPDPDQTLERFRTRHANTPVWVISFKPHHDIPRILSPAGRPRGDDLGYTTHRGTEDEMADDLEGVDQVTTARFARQARERHQETTQERTRREKTELDTAVDEFCKQRGISPTDRRTRARIRDGIQAGLRKNNGRAA